MCASYLWTAPRQAPKFAKENPYDICSHAHYDSEQFDIDRDELLGSVLPQKGVVAVINMAADYESLKKTVALCEKYDYIYGAVGIHPECANDLPDNWLSDVEALLFHPKIVAVGEDRLDYHWEDEWPREKQKEVLIAQLELCEKARPAVVTTTARPTAI